MYKITDEEIDIKLFNKWTKGYNIPNKDKLLRFFNECYQYHPDVYRNYNKGNYLFFLREITQFDKILN